MLLVTLFKLTDMAPKKDKGKGKAKASEVEGPLRYPRPDDDDDTMIVAPHLPTLDPVLRWYVQLQLLFCI